MDSASSILQIVIQAKNEASSQLNDVNKSLNNVQGSTSLLRDAMFAMGAAALGATVASVKMAGDFQETLTTLVTGAGESVKNIALINDGILTMASQVGQTSQALAQGIYMIESAGYHGAAALSVLQAAAEGAKVGGADLETTADAVTTVLKDYGSAAGGASGATNFLIGVVSQGKTHMQDLAGSLSQILPIASSLNIPLDQVGGAMAAMTARGIPAANAATNLRFTISALAKPTAAAATEMTQFGMNSTEVGTVLTTKGLLPALQLIQDQIAKKFPEGSAQYAAAISGMLGGTRGLQAGLSLTGKNMDDFINASKTVAKQMDSSKGSVMGWAEVQGDFNFQMQKLGDTAQAVAIRYGEIFLPMVTKVVGIIADDLIPAIDKATTFLEEHKTAVEIVAGALLGLMGLAVIIPVITAITTAFTFLSAIFAAFAAGGVIEGIGVAVAALGGPFTLIAAAIGIAAVLIITHWKQIVNAFEGTFAVIKALFTGGDITATWYQYFGTTFMGIAQLLDNFRYTLEGLWAFLVSFFTGGDITATWYQYFGTAFMGIIVKIDNFRDSAISIFQGFVSWIGSTFIPDFTRIIELLALPLTLQYDVYVLTFNLIKNLLSAFAAWFYSNFGQQIQAGFNIVINYLKNLYTQWIQIWNEIKTSQSELWNNLMIDVNMNVLSIKDFIITQFNSVSNWLTNSFITPMQTAWSGFWNNMKSIVSNIGNDIKNIAHDILSSIVGWINGLINGFNSMGNHVAGFIKLPDIPQFEQGGYVPSTGLALVHQGEFVLSNSMLSGSTSIPQQVSSNVNSNNQTPITIYATINSDTDMNLLGNKIAFAVKNSR